MVYMTTGVICGGNMIDVFPHFHVLAIIPMIYLEGWMDGRRDKLTDRRMDGQVGRWMDRRIDRWMDGWTDRQINKDIGMDG